MMAIPWWRTTFGEEDIAQLTAAVRGEHISMGPLTEQFECQMGELLHVPYVLAVPSGSAALLLALLALRIKPGDEVIVPNRTFIATAHAALLLGARAVLVDCRSDSPVMDVSQVEKKITSKTRVVMPVHLNGRAVDMASLKDLAKKYDFAIIEDAAQALFSQYQNQSLGTYGQIGCFSMGMTKCISTGQGGLVVTRSRELYEQMKLIRNHGVKDTLKDSYRQMGFNFKFTDLAACLGLRQLKEINERVAHLRGIYRVYEQRMAELPFLEMIPVWLDQGQLPLWVEVLCPEREKVMDFLRSRGIETRQFLPDLHLSPHLRAKGVYPNSTRYGQQGLFLPCGPGQPMENVKQVLHVLNKYKSH
ncbi:MAG: DegT/DnrJ/EryC1/StrS family aminotransferase [Sedimentisphaerales bacterium]|nr:DegT/DnrJ/EryC1/StrS family aminotransferase [Sedimentisphaerales bacterium]